MMYGIDLIIEDIYQMQKHSILTPYNLLNNAKLENYSYVKYYSNEKSEFFAEMQCLCEDGINRTFVYTFDSMDRLTRVTATPGNILETDLLFDRNIELHSLLHQYQERKDELFQKSVS